MRRRDYQGAEKVYSRTRNRYVIWIWTPKGYVFSHFEDDSSKIPETEVTFKVSPQDLEKMEEK